MATYAYTQTCSGAVNATVKYNITPGFDKWMGVNDTFTITGTVTATNKTVRCLSMRGPVNAYINKTFTKGSTVKFTITATITSDRISAIFYNQPASVTTRAVSMTFGLFTQPDLEGDAEVTTAVAGQQYTLIRTRQSPDLDIPFTITDQHPAISGSDTPLDFFGAFIQGESVPHLEIGYELDTRDAKLTATHTLTVTDTNDDVVYTETKTLAAQTGTVDFTLPNFDSAGTFEAEYICRDSSGRFMTYSEEITVLAYSPPTLTAWDVERCVRAIGGGSVPSPNGTYALLTIEGEAVAVDSKNAWTLTLTWGETGGATTDVQLDSGTDGDTISYTQDDQLFTTEIPASQSFTFTLTLADMLHSVSVVDEVPEGACYFDFEKNGVGIGMFTDGTAGDKRVDIHEDYTLYPRGNIVSPLGKLLKVVTVTASGTMSTSTTTMSKTKAVDAGSGWTPIGIVGTKASNSFCVIYRAQIDSDNVEMSCRYNGTSSGISITLTADVLCLRTSLT